MKRQETGSTRRKFIKSSAMAVGGLGFFPYLSLGKNGVVKPLKRSFGRCDFEVTTLGLGGQASIQWTPEDVDPLAIILKAHRMGINYFDTSNVYGPSQMNFGQAFRQLGLVPGLPGYREKARRSLFLTSKTGLRWSKGGDEAISRRGFSQGGREIHAMDDVRRSLSQIFGDGEGYYPDGAYLDMVLIHSLRSTEEINGLYTGLYDTRPELENIGALAGLRDLRDGTNRTGLNPKEERLIRHIGFSGHYSSPVMMEMIRRDRENLLDGMLVAINSNDRLYLNMQYNVIPLATARNMGIIAMKVFSDGAMYDKEARFSKTPEDVIRTVGSEKLPSRPLVEYSLSTPGVATAIIGIGHISENPRDCQLGQNLSAAQVAAQGLTESDRRGIERLTAPVKEGKTNYFQLDQTGLLPPQDFQIERIAGTDKSIGLYWQTAIAGDEPILQYLIECDGQVIAEVPFSPQKTATPWSYRVDSPKGTYRIVAVDKVGRRAYSPERLAG